jgi:hypothetical protein
MAKKLTEKEVLKLSKTTKGKVYIFLIEAIKLATENQYKDLLLEELMLRDTANYVDNKVEYIFGSAESPFWKDEFKGFEEIYSAAKNAKDDIANGSYTIKVIQFIESSIRSHIPKGVKIEEKEEIVIPEVTNQIIIEEGVRGKDLVKEKYKKEQEIEERQLSNDELEMLDDEEEFEDEKELEVLSDEEKGELSNLADEL